MLKFTPILEQQLERRVRPPRAGGDRSQVWGRTDSNILASLHPITLHPSQNQDHHPLPDWRCGVEKALTGRRGLGGGKCEGDDLGEFGEYGHKEGNAAAVYIPKCLRE